MVEEDIVHRGFMTVQVLKRKGNTDKRGGHDSDQWVVSSPLAPSVAYEGESFEDAAALCCHYLGEFAFGGGCENWEEAEGWEPVEVTWFLAATETIEFNRDFPDGDIFLERSEGEEGFRAWSPKLPGLQLEHETLDVLREKIFHLDHFLRNFAEPGWYKQVGELETVNYGSSN